MILQIPLNCFMLEIKIYQENKIKFQIQFLMMQNKRMMQKKRMKFKKKLIKFQIQFLMMQNKRMMQKKRMKFKKKLLIKIIKEKLQKEKN